MFLKVMYRLVLLLEGLDAQVKAALSGFDVRVMPLRFHVFHEREDEVHEGDLIFYVTQFKGKGHSVLAEKSYLSLEIFAFVKPLDFALE